MFRHLRLVTTLICFFVFSTASNAGGLVDGFRTFRWGSEPTSSMYKTERKANMQAYMSHDEDKNVLGLQADSITYYYFGGGLCRVEIAWWPQEISTLNQIQSSLEKRWGKSIKSNMGKGTRIIEWSSDSGITSGSLVAMDDAKDIARWYITIIIQGRECSKSAIEGSGL